MSRCWIFLFCLSIVFCSCETEFVPSFDVESIEGYRPVYEEFQTSLSIEEPREFTNPGSIYKYANYVLINDVSGYHILNNSTPASPQKIGFLQIPLNNNISIRNNLVYADSGNDLLAIRINADQTIIATRLEQVFDFDEDRSLPPESGFYFECIDNDKGDVVGWKRETISNPQCYF